MTATGGVPRVTLVVNHAESPSETFVRTLARLLLEEGHHVTVHELLPGRSSSEAGHEPATAVHRLQKSAALPGIRSPRFIPAALRFAGGDATSMRTVARRAVDHYGRGQRAAKAAVLAAPLLATRPDVVHIGFSPIGVALLDALELLDESTRLLVSCRGSGELVQPVLDPAVAKPLGRLLERADAVHAVSSDIARAVNALAPSQSGVHVIRPAIDTELFRRVAPRRPIGSPVHFITVSRLHWIKALDVQLAALAQLRARGVDARLTIVGDGPERDPLRFRAHVLGVSTAIDFAGARRPDEVRSLVERADVFVLSSLSEGTSNAVLEAMALEVPVISTAVGGMEEVLHTGSDALLVAPGDPNALREAMERVIAETGLADSLSVTGRRQIVERFGLERQRTDLQRLYRALLTPAVGTGGTTDARHDAPGAPAR